MVSRRQWGIGTARAGRAPQHDARDDQAASGGEHDRGRTEKS
jgi:hypothetical protein